MKNFRILTILLCLPFGLYQCQQPAGNGTGDEYVSKVREWRRQRLDNLKSPDGWLNLAGLYWLDEGRNTLGSDSTRDVVFPPKAPKHLGTLDLNNGQIRFTPRGNVKVMHDSSSVQGPMKLKSDASGEPTTLSHGPLRWYVIKRGDQYGIRLRDLESPLLDKLDSIPAYPVKPDWRIRATFVPYEEPKSITIPNVLGGTYQDESPGKLRFTYQGQQYTLHPTGSRESLFVVFGDDTNAETTYGGGRFLVVEGPNQDNITHLDFNKAYNPPCAFTPYATCPLPPRQNILPFQVDAGEKAPGLERTHSLHGTHQESDN